MIQIIGIGAFIGAFLQFIISVIFFKKNRESLISKAFATFFFCVTIGLAEIGSYYLLTDDPKTMALLYSSLYIVSMIGVLSLVLGVRQLVFPKNNPFKSPIIPTIILIAIIMLYLSFTDVTHIVETKNPLYTPLFMIGFILTFNVPLTYIIYQLTKKRDWISEERKKWFKNLRYFFFLTAVYPVIEALSGYSNATRILDFGNGIFIFTSLMIMYYLPSYKDWYVDELKTITVINQLKNNYNGSLEHLWKSLDLWQEEFKQKNKELTILEFEGYLKEIEESIVTKWK